MLRQADAEIAYTISGDGPTVLCIQGVGVIGDGWRPQVDALDRRFQVITFDNRGLGGSSAPAGPLSLDSMVADAVAILNQERITRCHVLGHSMGGLIAQHVALAAPDRVASLALLCTFANGADATSFSWPMMVHGLRSRLGTRAMRRQGMVRMIMPPEHLRGVDRVALATQLGQLFGRDLADSPPIIMRQLRAMSASSAAPRLRELSGIPTLVVSGAHDPIAPPRLGRAIAEAVGGSRFVEFAHASHALPIQCANAVNALLLDHFSAANRR